VISTAIVAAVVLPLFAASGAASGAVASVTASAPAEPPLRVVAAAPSVTLDRFEGDPFLFLDLGVHAVAGQNAFEIRATRRSYADPIVATQYLHQGGTRTRRLPGGLLDDFTGLPGFLHVTLTNAAGEIAAEQDQTFCPNSSDGGRARPDAPDTSPFPQTCGRNPFTLGSVWGIQAGWSVPTTDWFNPVIGLPDGRYTARVTVAQEYRDLFGIPDAELSVDVTVTSKAFSSASGRSTTGQAPRASGPNPVPNPARPTGAATVPTGPKPDLIPLPAWEVNAFNGGDLGQPDDDKDYLAFNANVWNAGPSPIVVDGFRQPGQDTMDAFQYFYDSKGKQIGYAPTGTMEFDRRDGHEHWHFKDFAGYQLLDESRQEVVRSQKEAFCLAPTDPIDQTVRNANWRPGNTDLHTACGGQTALSIREVLDVGHGDTYQQFLPGQAFDITGLPNGTYYIRVTANPDRRLYESNTANNTSLRKIILAGTPTQRIVTVPPYQLIDAP